MSTAMLYFAPWLRRGLSRLLVGAADADGVPTGGLATVTASVSLGSDTATRDVQVRGPGAVLGLSAAQVVRRHPVAGTQDFERNVFAHIELASPDLPWMFTPASPTDDRLLPWLVLVVVEEHEGVSFETSSSLSVLTVDAADSELPDLRQAWAWAHVQSSALFTADDVQTVFDAQPEAMVARLLCPRRLDTGKAYRACLVPSFRAGRQAGLGEPFDADDVSLAWSTGDTDVRLPVYESWRFRTAAEPGDFETLVRRLTARTLSGDVGVHALDIGTPGSAALPDAPGTTTAFVGALVAPELNEIPWDEDHQAQFQGSLRTLLNDGLAATGSEPADYDPLLHDPAVAPPVYGARPADVDRVPRTTAPAGPKRPKWLSGANLDPAARATAGLGAQVVRQHQEPLMAQAWAQAEAAQEANALLNRTRMALEVGKRLKGQVADFDDGALLQLSRAAHGRLKDPAHATTVAGRLGESVIPDGLVSSAFRRRLHTGTTVAKAIDASRESSTQNPCSAVTQDFVRAPLDKLAYATLTVPQGSCLSAESDQADITVEMVQVTQDFGLAAGLRVSPATTSFTPITRDLSPSPITRSSRRSARATPSFVGASTRVPSPLPVATDSGGDDAAELRELDGVIRDRLDPEALLRVRVRHLIQPSSLLGTEDVPASLAMDPQYPDPLYELLVRIDPELLMPGVGTIPQDTVALAKLNASFVEAFLLGANHELGREFLWREFPADPGDTWLRVFWDAVMADPLSDSGAVEDIPRVREWATDGLGNHTTRDPDQVLALIVKGDLLKRYPNTLIYAVAATWDSEAGERIEDDMATPLYPSFVGSLGDGVTFLGFEFPADVAVDPDEGDSDVVGTTVVDGPQPGWFFVFEELPTEPCFGMDEGKPGAASKVPNRWENLNWYHALGEADPEPATVDLETLTTKHGGTLRRRYDDDGDNTWRETWGLDAAGMARITLQRPVRMLVHADQMLEPAPEEPADGL